MSVGCMERRLKTGLGLARRTCFCLTACRFHAYVVSHAGLCPAGAWAMLEPRSCEAVCPPLGVRLATHVSAMRVP
eukprot:3499782-Alexandrium_andersonii.AAC.1